MKARKTELVNDVVEEVVAVEDDVCLVDREDRAGDELRICCQVPMREDRDKPWHAGKLVTALRSLVSLPSGRSPQEAGQKPFSFTSKRTPSTGQSSRPLKSLWEPFRQSGQDFPTGSADWRNAWCSGPKRNSNLSWSCDTSASERPGSSLTPAATRRWTDLATRSGTRRSSLMKHTHMPAGSGGQRNTSASACDGVLKPSVCRGRSLSSWAMASKSSWVRVRRPGLRSQR